ncbi:hypothetical protein SESBI_10778 [Sesbania bispinosa]|nr:hypothetical protein SESBI_10778 [Sesbania bispinosa]
MRQASSPSDADNYLPAEIDFARSHKPLFASSKAQSPSLIDHFQPSDTCLIQSQPQPKSTIRVHTQTLAQPSHHEKMRSQPFPINTIHVPSTQIQHLEDKVPTEPGGNDSGPTRPKRNVQKPYCLKDFI